MQVLSDYEDVIKDVLSLVSYNEDNLSQDDRDGSFSEEDDLTRTDDTMGPFTDFGQLILLIY